jgi:hypothetical protein
MELWLLDVSLELILPIQGGLYSLSSQLDSIHHIMDAKLRW